MSLYKVKHEENNKHRLGFEPSPIHKYVFWSNASAVSPCYKVVNSQIKQFDICLSVMGGSPGELSEELVT